jgi:hypothetical protein
MDKKPRASETVRLAIDAGKIIVCLLLGLSLAVSIGCDASATDWTANKTETVNNHPISKIRYDAGFIFANRDHAVGIDVSSWALSSVSQVREIKSSCECTTSSLKEIGEGSGRHILVINVAADPKMVRNASLAVSIEAVLQDNSTRSMTFEFTHVAMPSSETKE